MLLVVVVGGVFVMPAKNKSFVSHSGNMDSTLCDDYRKKYGKYMKK